MNQKEDMTIGFIGNPNCGKTTLFNAYTGANLKVANWPGVTVEKVEGAIRRHDLNIRVVDLPGAYSLTSYTMEEIVSRQFILSDEVDVIINVIDASVLERSLYLTLQLLELGKPAVVALNMMDVVKERGMEIDMHRLPEMLGNIPVVPVSAARRTGLDILLHAVIHHCEEGMEDYILDYPQEIEEKITELTAMMQVHYPSHSSARWHAIKLLEDDEDVRNEHPMQITNIADHNYEKEIIQAKYAHIEQIIFYKKKKAASTDRIDSLLTHPLWGIPMFLLVMCLVFFLTFTVGDALKGVFESGLDMVSDAAAGLLEGMGAAGWLNSLIVEGIIAGVGGILTFIPNIFILFLALALLEDSGYPGMKVLEFAFDPREKTNYLPHSYDRNCVVYTGTHDNETLVQWYKGLDQESRDFAAEYMDNAGTPEGEKYWDFVRMAMMSSANTCIIPIQDYLGLDADARINKPSTLGGNWEWRMDWKMLSREITEKIYQLTRISFRLPEEEQQKLLDLLKARQEQKLLEMQKLLEKQQSEKKEKTGKADQAAVQEESGKADQSAAQKKSGKAVQSAAQGKTGKADQGKPAEEA